MRDCVLSAYPLVVFFTALVETKCMQMGAFALASARTASGTDQRPPPAMTPAAAGTKKTAAAAGLAKSHVSLTRDPTPMSTASLHRR